MILLSLVENKSCKCTETSGTKQIALSKYVRAGGADDCSLETHGMTENGKSIKMRGKNKKTTKSKKTRLVGLVISSLLLGCLLAL